MAQPAKKKVAINVTKLESSASNTLAPAKTTLGAPTLNQPTLDNSAAKKSILKPSVTVNTAVKPTVGASTSAGIGAKSTTAYSGAAASNPIST